MSGRSKILFLVVAIALLGSISAQQPNRDKAIAEGRDALAKHTDFPWYDADKDGIRRLDVAPPKDVVGRKSKWEVRPAPAWSWPSWLSTLLKILGWTALVLLLVTLIYLLTKAALIETWRSAGSGLSEESLHGDIDRIEALPFQLQRPQTDLLAEARRHYEAGNYGEAVIYLYSYQLVELDRHRFIRLAKGKTNRQYLREVRSTRPLFDVLHETMVMFEDVFFGHHSVQRDRFEQSWHKLDEFHRHLVQAVV